METESGRETARPIVLVVDDDVGILKAYGRLLEAEAEVILARGFDEALDRIGDGGPSAAILDIDLAEHRTGIDLRDELRRRWPDLPVLFITGSGLFRNPAVQIDLDPIARKPVDEETLLEFVRGRRRAGKPVDVIEEVAKKIGRRKTAPTPPEGTVVAMRSIGIPTPLVSEAMACSESNVRQLEARGLEKLGLRSYLEARDSIGKRARVRLAKAIHEILDGTKRTQK